MVNSHYILSGFGGPFYMTQGFSFKPPVLFDEGLETYLASQLGVPIYSGNIPQGVTSYPAVTYTLIYETHYNTLAKAAGLVNADYQIDIWGDIAEIAEQLNEVLLNALESYKGMMGDTYVSSSRLQDEDQDAEEFPSGSDQWIYRYQTDWTFIYQESIPT